MGMLLAHDANNDCPIPEIEVRPCSASLGNARARAEREESPLCSNNNNEGGQGGVVGEKWKKNEGSLRMAGVATESIT